MKHKVLIGTISAIFAFLLVATPVLASTYYSIIVTQNTGALSYGMAPVISSVDNATLAANGYISSSGLDTRVNLAGNNLPWMVTNDKVLFAMPLAANSNYNPHYLLGETAADSMNIITGSGGYITTADNAALEPGNNFEIEAKAYFDVSAGAYKNVVNKDVGIKSYISSTGELTTNIFGAPAVNESYLGWNSNASIYGVNWYAQTFTPSATGYLTSVMLYLARSGSPSGNFNVSLYATSGGLPTGSALYSISSASASAISTSHSENNFALSSPYALTSGTVYAIVASCPSGDYSNTIMWDRRTIDEYARGQDCTSTNSGSSWSAEGYDFKFSITMTSIVATSIASGLTTGEHTLKITADGTNLKTYWDGTQKDSDALGAVSVQNNANNWIFCQNGVMPYINYIKITVGGTLVLWYQPVAIISGATLPDRAGTAQNGTITFGANLADVTASAGILHATGATVASGSVTTTKPAILPTMATPTARPLITNPFSTLFAAISDASEGEITVTWIWIFMAAVVTEMLIVVILAKFQNQLLAGGVGIFALAVAMIMGIFDWWMLFIFALDVVAIVLMERKQSI